MSAARARLARISFETIASVVAMFIGACALFVAWDQAQVMRAQQHASVWPILDTDFEVNFDSGGWLMRLSVKNAGVGPALVESAEIVVNGRPVRAWSDIERALFGDALSDPVSFDSSEIEESVIAPGDSVRVIESAWAAGGEDGKAVSKALFSRYVAGASPRLGLRVCYCSVFERCWRAEAEEKPVRVKHCPAPTHFVEALFAGDEAEGAE